MKSDEALRRFQERFGSPRLFRWGTAAISCGMGTTLSILGEGFGILVVPISVLAGVLVLGLLVKVSAAGLGHLILNPFSDFVLYFRACWWALYWPKPDARAADWVAFSIAITGLLLWIFGLFKLVTT